MLRPAHLLRAVDRSWYRDFMNSRACLWAVGCAIALSGCDTSSDPAGSGTTGEVASTTDEVATTIPVTSLTATLTDTTSEGSTSESGTTGSSTQTSTGTSSSSTSSGSGSDSSSGTDGSSSSSTGATTTGAKAWDIEWCNLQFPAEIEGSTATITTAYARLYVEGLTDQSPGNDEDAMLQVEFGYGTDGSDPGVDVWTWTEGSGNVGWNGNDAGEPNNDEYQADLQFAQVGTYDYAARVSGDGGETWVYCDLDGLVAGGYSPDQAGNAVIE